MRSQFFTDDQQLYRETVREFLEREVTPHYADWERNGWIDRDVYTKAAEQGIYGLRIPERYGGADEHDYRFRVVVAEEVARAHATSFGVTLSVQDDLVLNYLLNLATPEQKSRWLPGYAEGRLIGALAITEPEAGSDLRGIRTSARRAGSNWILNGQKTFISSGIMSDLIVVAARTDPVEGASRLSLFVVERDAPGLVRGRKLAKVGLAAQDTVELFFEDCVVPGSNLLGVEGEGLKYLLHHLPSERLGVTVNAMATCRAIFDVTRRYCLERKAFAKRIADFQHVRFELAEMATEIDVAEAYVDRSVLAYNEDRLSAVDAAKGKWYVTELQKRVVDRCLQLHGGYGYMQEYPVARAFVDTRVQTIYGGTTAIMKDIIGRDLTRG